MLNLGRNEVGSVPAPVYDRSTGDKECIHRIAFALHEMCQPLMALQCRLEIGRMMGTAEGYQEAVRESLTECDRLISSLNILRDEVRHGLDRSSEV